MNMGGYVGSKSAIANNTASASGFQPINVNGMSRSLWRKWKPLTSNTKAYFKWFKNVKLKEIKKQYREAHGKKLPRHDESRSPNMMVPLSMAYYNQCMNEAMRKVDAMYIDVLAKSLVFKPIYREAINEAFFAKTNRPASEFFIAVDAKDLAKVEGIPPAEAWLRSTLRSRINKYAFTRKAKEAREERVDSILELCRFEGSRIYINENTKVATFDLKQSEFAAVRYVPPAPKNGKKHKAAADGVSISPVAEPAMKN
jgi:hypothetical protein